MERKDKDRVDDQGQVSEEEFERQAAESEKKDADTDDKVAMYRDRMVESFDAALVVMEKAELLAEEGVHLDAQVRLDAQLRIALTIFDRATRQMPEQEKIFGLALQYAALFIEEKTADIKHSQELRAGAGFIPSVPPPPSPCNHEGLKALREALMCEDDLSHAAIDALSVTRDPGPDVDVTIRRMLCPHCLAYVLTDMVESGHLWREPTEEKHGEPAGPSVGDTPIFLTDLVEVLADGLPTMFVMKDGDRSEDMQIAEAIADGQFFETIYQRSGYGLYVFMLWKKDMTLYSSHEFRVPPREEA